MTETITAQPVKDFMPYAKLGKSNAKIQQRIALLLAKLAQAKSERLVKQLCKDELAWFLSEYEGSSSRTTYMSAYRKAIQACFNDYPIPEGLEDVRETVKGTVRQHLAIKFMLAPAEDYAAIGSKNKAKTAEQRDNLTGFDIWAAIEASEHALRSEDWRELAAGLILAVQSRPSDMLQSGDFKAISKYRVQFTSKAKKRGKEVTGEVWTLVDSATFIDAFHRLRRVPDVMEMKEWALKDVDSGKNSTLNRAIQRVYGETIPAPYGEKELSAKNLRAAGVNIGYHLYGSERQSIGRFAELQLLHDSPGVAANYEDFYCIDGSGKRVSEIGIRQDAPLDHKPDSVIRSSLTLDKQLLAEVSDHKAWGEGSHADRLARIIAKAKTTDELATKLARERQRRVALENKIIELEQQLAAVQQKQETTEQLEPVKVTANRDDDYWRSIPNEELLGSRKRGAHEEKLRRTVEAIQEFNAGRELSEQYAINSAILRAMTGAKPTKIAEWMEEHQEELEAYADAQGHSYRQNVGKADPKSVIKWSEKAYGKYEW